ncbi:porin family protein [Ferruginibacter sp. SUN002]|uniref:porin family protein n=1 Tax=Ferruginibacter sp. SUN002 TaxID=2937789 RepID=UPI003D363CDD
MKTLITGLAVFLILTNANAQTVYVQGGLNLANITTTNSGNTEENKLLPTFNVGFMGRFGLSKVVDLEAGLLFTGKGSKAETFFNGGTDYVKTRFNPLYIELPLNVVVTVPFNKTSASGFFFNAGPYVAVGIAGKSKVDTKFGPLTTSSTEDIKFANDDPFTSEQDDAAYDKLKRFDYGLNIGGGVKMKSVILKANYGFGLAKINSTAGDNNANDKNKYRTLSISVGIPLN